jgi:hypothetical protein
MKKKQSYKRWHGGVGINLKGVVYSESSHNEACLEWGACIIGAFCDRNSPL